MRLAPVWLLCLLMAFQVYLPINLLALLGLAYLIYKQARDWSTLQLVLVLLMSLLPIWQVIRGNRAQDAMPELPDASSLLGYVTHQNELPEQTKAQIFEILNGIPRPENPFAGKLFDKLDLPDYVSVSLLSLDMLPISWRGQFFRGDYGSLHYDKPELTMRDGRLFQVTLEPVPNPREARGFLLTEVLLLSEHPAERETTWLAHCNPAFERFRPVVVEREFSEIIFDWAADLHLNAPLYDIHLIPELDRHQVLDFTYLLWALVMVVALFYIWRHLKGNQRPLFGFTGLVLLVLCYSGAHDGLSCFASFIFGARWLGHLFSTPMHLFFALIFLFLVAQALIRVHARRAFVTPLTFAVVAVLALLLPNALQRACTFSFVHPLEALGSPGAFLTYAAFAFLFAGFVLLFDATRPMALRPQLVLVACGLALVSWILPAGLFTYVSVVMLFFLRDKRLSTPHKAALAMLFFYPSMLLKEQAAEVTYVKEQFLDEITLLGERNYFRMSRIIQRLPEIERQLERGDHAHMMELFAKKCGLLENEVDFSLTLVGPNNRVTSEISYHLATDRLRILSTAPNRIDTFRSESDNSLWMVFRRTLITSNGDYDFTVLLGSDYQNLSLVREPRNLSRKDEGLPSTITPYYAYVFEVFDEQANLLHSQGSNTTKALSADDLLKLQETPVFWRVEGRNTVFFIHDKETIYRITHKATSLTLIFSRFLLLWLGLSFLVAVVRLTQRPGRGLLARWRRSFSMKLAAFMFLASGLPTATLGFFLIQSIQQNQAREELSFAQSRMLAAQNLFRGLNDNFEDESESYDFRGLPLHTYSRILGEDLSLYHGGNLINTNQPEMYRMGYMNRRLPFKLAHSLLVEKTPFVFEHTSDTGKPAVAYARVKLSHEREDVLAMTIIPFSQRQQLRWLEQIEFSLSLLLGLLFLMGLLTRYLAKNFLRPISAITHSAARMAKGLVNRPIAIDRQDELERMVAAFNTMQDQVQGSQNQLRQQLRLLDETMSSMSSGLLGFNPEGKIILENTKAWRLLQMAETVKHLAKLVEHEPQLMPLQYFFDEGSSGEFDFQLKRDGEERQIIGKVRLVRAQKESDVRCIVAFEDMTDALAANRFKAWAEMARRVAHEIKNPLTPIQLELDHLNKLYKDEHPSFGEALVEASEEIRTQVEHLKRIATEFSDYARPLELQRSPTDIGGLLREILDPYEKTLPRVRIIHHLADVSAQVDSRLLRRALHNLIVNAIQAMDREGELRVTLGLEESDVVITIQDTGPGIPLEDQDKVFEAYFSTKDQGSGLGLVIARKYLSSHDGDLTIDKEYSQGTRFIARFPQF